MPPGLSEPYCRVNRQAWQGFEFWLTGYPYLGSKTGVPLGEFFVQNLASTVATASPDSTFD